MVIYSIEIIRKGKSYASGKTDSLVLLECAIEEDLKKGDKVILTVEDTEKEKEKHEDGDK